MLGRWYLRFEFQGYLFPRVPFTERGIRDRCLTVQGLGPLL